MFRPKNVAIIGGSGLMGQWFSKLLISNGCKVMISGRRYQRSARIARTLGAFAAKSNEEAIKGADLVIISVMMRDFERTIRKLAPYLEGNQRIIDVTSVKSEPVRLMHRYLGRNLVLGTHPMFGPAAEASGQNFVLTPTNRKEKAFAAEISRYLGRMGFNVVVMSPKRHDQMIGTMLSLTHFVGFVTGDTWRELHIHKFMKTSSTSFRFLKSFVKSIVDASPELYSYLQVGVPDAYPAEKEFVKKSMEWAELARKGNDKKLRAKMSSLGRYISRL